MRKWLIVVRHGLDAGKAISHIEVVRGEDADWEVLHKKQKIAHNRRDQVCSAHKDRSTVLISLRTPNRKIYQRWLTSVNSTTIPCGMLSHCYTSKATRELGVR